SDIHFPDRWLAATRRFMKMPLTAAAILVLCPVSRSFGDEIATRIQQSPARRTVVVKTEKVVPGAPVRLYDNFDRTPKPATDRSGLGSWISGDIGVRVLVSRR